MAALNIDTAIAEFLADPVCSSLKLPHMTTGQRKHTKKVLEQYPQLRSESYGFGAERQLHLFKKCEVDAHQEEDSGASTTIASSSSQGELGAVIPGGASGTLKTSAVVDGSPAASDLDAVFPFPRGGFQVRNTFIHIESTSVDERAIQSMPHGMFRQCILADEIPEFLNEWIPEFPATPSSVSSESEMVPAPAPEQVGRLLPFSVGTSVVVERLVKLPAFNGCSAVVQGWDEATGRYDIVIASPSGCLQAKIKEENLRTVSPSAGCYQ